jgi:AcrR family transcriptional regulator
MVQVTFKGQDHIRVDQIIEVARQRFGIYGYEKTTMQEVARDLQISKGSLYYYFPDKEHLYKAIFSHEHEVFITAIRDEISRSSDPVEMLEKFIATRMELFRSLMNLSNARMDTPFMLPAFLHEILIRNRQQEKAILIEILENGISGGLFIQEDSAGLAELLLDLLKGLRMIMMKERTLQMSSDEPYRLMEQRTHKLTQLFIRSIKKK